MTEHEDWLNLTMEKAIEPALPICDAHHHLRNLQGQRYVTADFVKDASGGHNIKQSVVIQSTVNYDKGPGGGMSYVDETEFVMKDIASVKSKTDVSAAFVGFADFMLGNGVAATLEAHEAKAQGRFRGIRYIPPRKPGTMELKSNVSVLSDPKFREGVSNLRKYNLSYDLMISLPQFSEIADIAKNFPDTTIIINHLGWAGYPQNVKEREDLIKEWRRRITLLTPHQNIYMKLGGLGMAHAGLGFDKRPKPPGSEELAKATAPYYLYCVEQFGPKRCMFESNFPPDKESYSYTVVWNSFKLMTKDFSRTERATLFHDTAASVYRIK